MIKFEIRRMTRQGLALAALGAAAFTLSTPAMAWEPA